MNNYIVLNRHHIGKSHIIKNMICEDHSESYSDDDVCIAVISDGHGDKNCFRSKKGAEIACGIAISNLKRFYSGAENFDDNESFEKSVKNLEKSIADEWRETVLEDAANNPFTDTELSALSDETRIMYSTGKKNEKAYGCTLISVMFTDNYWVALQIGDGKCVSVYDDGVYLEPIPKDDENCCGNRSSSICSADAEIYFRHCYSKRKPNAVFVVSDGIEESFNQSDLYSCFYTIQLWGIEYDHVDLYNRIDELLPKISEGGSGDDVSIAGIVNKNCSAYKPRQTLESVYSRVDACSDALAHWEQEESIELKKLNDAENKIEEYEKLILELTQKLSDVDEDREKEEQNKHSIRERLNSISENKKKAQEQTAKAAKYKEAAEKFWEDKIEQLEIFSCGAGRTSSYTETSDDAAIDGNEFNSNLPEHADKQITSDSSEDEVLMDNVKEEADYDKLLRAFNESTKKLLNEGFILNNPDYEKILIQLRAGSRKEI